MFEARLTEPRLDQNIEEIDQIGQEIAQLPVDFGFLPGQKHVERNGEEVVGDGQRDDESPDTVDGPVRIDRGLPPERGTSVKKGKDSRQGRMEPAPVVVAALVVHIHGFFCLAYTDEILKYWRVRGEGKGYLGVDPGQRHPDKFREYPRRRHSR